MNKLIACGIFASALLLSPFQAQAKQEPMKKVVDHGLKASTEQAILMAKSLEDKPGRVPMTIGKDGKFETSTYSWWCSGFYPGELWYLYEANPTPELKKYAQMYTARVEKAAKITYSHDVGFQINCSFGNGYRLTGNPQYKEVMLRGAKSLATRYNKKLGLIRSWDFNRQKWQYPVIIDNMMNLEFFCEVSKLTGDNTYRDMAISHANRTLQNHFRPDYSCYHVVSYDTITGNPHVKQTHQGYADNSAWARGQAWALYGYTMMYRETGKPEYLAQAKHVAAYLMNHPKMPADKVPYWDFDDPAIPNTTRDASAAAVMASALIELSQVDKSKEAKGYLKYAEDQVRSLTSDAYLAKKGQNCNFALMHSTGNKPGNSEVDVPLTYADYYYVEALVRLKKLYKK